jgi:hypothetical protein
MMMTILKRTVLPGIFILSMLLTWTVTAAESDDLSIGKGNIEYLDLKAGEIVVGDVGLVLGTDYIVKNRAGKIVSAFNLRKGIQVEVKHNSRKVVKEIIIQ